MQINYIILTNKNPIQLERLISKLEDKDVTFFVHIDAKANIESFKYLEKDNVIFLENRVDVIWGDFSIVQATLNAMKSVIEHRDQGYTILLSGQDYPIKSKQEIKNYLQENQNFDFIEFRKVETVWETYRERTIARKLNLSSKKGMYVTIFSIPDIHNFREFYVSCKNVLKFFIHSAFKNYTKIIPFLFKKRKPLVDCQYAGSAWWAFQHSTVIKILELITTKKEVIDYYKECLLPDEIFFQTLINSIPNYKIQVKDSITYVNWERKNCPLPVTFDGNDLQEILKQPENKLFARKFDIDLNSSSILDEIDRLIHLK